MIINFLGAHQEVEHHARGRQLQKQSAVRCQQLIVLFMDLIKLCFLHQALDCVCVEHRVQQQLSSCLVTA